MYIDTTSYLNSLTPDTTTDDDEDSSSLGKDDFLTLLVAQLENQDPFNPTDEKEMISQLAQFSSLEQLTNISETLESGLSVLNAQTATSAVSYIGKSIVAEGYELTKDGEDISDTQFSLDDSVYGVTAHIYDENGKLVQTEYIGDLAAGDHTYEWDGLDYNGDEVDDGTYVIALTGYSDEALSEAVSITTNVSGVVTGMSFDDGSVVLTLADGREVDLMNIIEVTGSAN